MAFKKQGWESSRWRTPAPTKFRVASCSLPLKAPLVGEPEAVQMCALGNPPPPAGLGRVQTAKPRLRNQKWYSGAEPPAHLVSMKFYHQTLE